MKKILAFKQVWFSLSLLLGALVFFFSLSSVFADPPKRVARISYIDGQVSFLPTGEQTWGDAAVNRPLIIGDRLWSDTNAKLELQLGQSAIRLGPSTDTTLLNFTDNIAQFELDQGNMNVKVWVINADQSYEVDTPNLAFTTTQSGNYRIDVDANKQTTTVTVWEGEATVYGENASYLIQSNQSFTFSGKDLSNYQTNTPEADEFDQWCTERDQRSLAKKSTRYVSPQTIGFEDLDHYGTWRNDATYGNVWAPSSIPDDWAPYQNGYWVWLDPWGWTWIDEAPWGFAPFHYGRWAYTGYGWVWVPGPPDVEPFYAPALVVFIGGGGFDFAYQGGFEQGIGWFPLGPADPFIPAYPVSNYYFTNINITNSFININILHDLYKHKNKTIHYQNLHAKGAVTTVPAKDFVNAKPVSGNRLPLAKDKLDKGKIRPFTDLKPTPASIRGTKPATIKPPTGAGLKPKPVLVKTMPVVKPSARPSGPSFEKIKTIAKPVLPAAKPVTAPISPPGKIKPTQPSVIHAPTGPVTPTERPSVIHAPTTVGPAKPTSLQPTTIKPVKPVRPLQPTSTPLTPTRITPQQPERMLPSRPQVIHAPTVTAPVSTPRPLMRRPEQVRPITQPRPIGQPRINQQPRVIQQPRMNQQPRVIQQPRMNLQPRPIQQPRITQPTMPVRSAPPRQVNPMVSPQVDPAPRQFRPVMPATQPPIIRQSVPRVKPRQAPLPPAAVQENLRKMKKNQ